MKTLENQMSFFLLFQGLYSHIPPQYHYQQGKIQTFWFIFFATDVSLQSIFKSSLNSEKTSGCQMNKKIIFESICSIQ